MTAKQNPTNKDLYTALGEIKSDVKSIHEQVKRTNGRVTTLEKKEFARGLIEEFIKDQGIKSPSEEKAGWSKREQALIGIIMAMLGIASAVVGGAL